MSDTIILTMGVVLWWAAHLFKRVFPDLRERLGNPAKGVVALVIVTSIVLMIIGYRGTEATFLYALPTWAWHLNNVLMVFAIYLMDAGRTKGVIRTHIRHPMLSGVLVWSVAHLLVNGDVPSAILFGGLGLWAVAQMWVINRAEGEWTRPALGKWRNDGITFAVSLVIYGVIVGIHYWLLGYSVFWLI